MLCLNLEEVSSRAVSVLHLLKSTSVIGIATDWESVHSFIISLHSVHRNKRVTVALHLQSKTNIIKVGPPNKKKVKGGFIDLHNITEKICAVPIQEQ
jgi:hypothetical protein